LLPDTACIPFALGVLPSLPRRVFLIIFSRLMELGDLAKPCTLTLRGLLPINCFQPGPCTTEPRLKSRQNERGGRWKVPRTALEKRSIQVVSGAGKSPGRHRKMISPHKQVVSGAGKSTGRRRRVTNFRRRLGSGLSAPEMWNK